MKKYLFALGICISFLDAKELFTPETIENYLNEQNPYVYPLLTQEKIAKEGVKLKYSSFDTLLSAKYDDKDYPSSWGEYYNFSITKPLQNGIELLGSYRNAQGTQEYNNIKTSTDGEVLVGVKLPLNSLFQGTNAKKTQLEIALANASGSKFNTNNQLRLFYLQVLKTYYTLLYNKIDLVLEEELYETAKKREYFIEQKVDTGSLADLALVEIKQQIINREQRYLNAKNAYENTLTTFTTYLNLTKEDFQNRYDLLDLLELQTTPLDLESMIEQAHFNRPDLRVLSYEKEKLLLEQKNNTLLAYPSLNLSLYGVHDFKYDNGYKVSVEATFPLEQNRYEARDVQIKTSLNNISKLQEQKRLEISAGVTKTVNSLNLLEKNIQNAEEELLLVEKIEDAEATRYELGSSNLFLLNQRELATLEVKKKLLSYKLNYLLLTQELNAQMGKMFTKMVKQ